MQGYCRNFHGLNCSPVIFYFCFFLAPGLLYFGLLFLFVPFHMMTSLLPYSLLWINYFLPKNEWWKRILSPSLSFLFSLTLILNLKSRPTQRPMPCFRFAKSSVCSLTVTVPGTNTSRRVTLRSQFSRDVGRLLFAFFKRNHTLHQKVVSCIRMLVGLHHLRLICMI